MLARYTDWVIGWSKRKEAEKALGAFSFAESSFFPIPVDPLLTALVFSKPKHVFRLVNITALSSVAGGAFGYLIGALLMTTIGAWILDTYNLHEAFISLGNKYQANTFLVVFTTAFTPIPFKVIAVSAGAFGVNFASFILASLLRRYLRFGAVGWLSSKFGERYQHKIGKFINLLSGLVIAFVAVFTLITIILLATN